MASKKNNLPVLTQKDPVENNPKKPPPIEPKVIKFIEAELEEKFLVIEAKLEKFMGPLPHPDHFRDYEKVLSGAAERILSLTEKQSAHRQGIATKVTDANIKHEMLGLIFGLILGLALIGSAVYCAYIDQPWVAGALGVGGITGVVTSFVKGLQDTRKDKKSV